MKKADLKRARALFALIVLTASLASSGSLSAQDLEPLKLKLPEPAFIGTPKDAPEDTTVEPPSDKPKPPLMVPKGLSNVAAGKQPTSSVTNAPPEMLAKITDGDKEATDRGVVFLRKGPQYVQIDLGKPHEIFAIAIWHDHSSPKVYRDVIVQVADNAEFTENVRTLFNNDQDNSSKVEIGKDREYFETNEGKVVDGKGQKARYVRTWSKGSTESGANEYIEIEVYGRPAS